VSGRKLQTHPLRHGYERLLLCWWLIAMLSLAFPWWKSIEATGAVVIQSPICIGTLMMRDGALGLIGSPSRSSWHLHHFYSSRARPAMSDSVIPPNLFGKFHWGSHRFPSEKIVLLPIWFLMLAGSLLFWALHLFMKRRIRRIMENLPIPTVTGISLENNPPQQRLTKDTAP
jgi:hypothetical protein